jgi:hypothetical protein
MTELVIQREGCDNPKKAHRHKCLQMHASKYCPHSSDAFRTGFPGKHSLVASILPKELEKIDDEENEFKLTDNCNRHPGFDQDDPLDKDERKPEHPCELKRPRRIIKSKISSEECLYHTWLSPAPYEITNLRAVA